MEDRFDLRCCFILILLTGVAQLRTACAMPPSSSSLPTPSSPVPILDKISYCDTVKFMKDSTYLSECKNITYPTKYDTGAFEKENKNVLSMCMMVLDIATKICVHDSTLPATSDEKYKLRLPKTAKEFDELLDKFQPKNYESFKKSLCDNITSLFIQLQDFKSDEDVESYVKYVNDDALKSSECPYTCRKRSGEVNKFCMIFFWANNIFVAAKPQKIDTGVSTVTKSISVVNDPNLQKETNKKNVPEPSIGENPKSKESKDKLVDLTQVLPDVKDSEKAVNQAPKSPEKTNDQYQTSAIENAADEQAVKAMKIFKTIKPEIEQNNKEMLSDNKIPPNNGAQNQNNIPAEIENGEDVNSNEDLNKKNNDNEAGDINDPDNNEKDSINNLDEKNLSNNQEQFNLPQENRKYFSPMGNEEDESHFVAYFVVTMVCVLLYLGFHNKQKILAMALEGRRSRGGRRGRRRPSTASYRKLDSNLEEAVTSQCNSNVTHVIY